MRWANGEHIQNVWPEKTPDERELLMSGIHPDCWDKMFKPQDEDDFVGEGIEESWNKD